MKLKPRMSQSKEGIEQLPTDDKVNVINMNNIKSMQEWDMKMWNLRNPQSANVYMSAWDEEEVMV